MTSGATEVGATAEGCTHWRVVAGAGLGVATGYGLFPFVASQFVQPLKATSGWPRAAQALTQTAAIGGALLAPALTGVWIDRVWAPIIGRVFSVGLAPGAELNLAGYMIARYFGIADFAAIFGLSIWPLASVPPRARWLMPTTPAHEVDAS